MSHGERLASMNATPRQRRSTPVAARRPVAVPTSSELHMLHELRGSARNKRKCPDAGRSTSTGAIEAAEEAALSLAAAADVKGSEGVRLLVEQLQKLEAST